MLAISNSIYNSLKKRGIHNWGFLNLKEREDFDWDDLVSDYQYQCIRLEEFEE